MLKTIKINRSYHKLFRSLVLLWLCTASGAGVFCQMHNDDWETLRIQHDQGALNDTAYLNKLALTAEKSLKDPRFREKLEHYRKIAWSKKQYQSYRVKYYSLLVNNAAVTHKEGAAVYYMQKSEQELKTITPYINSLNEPRYLLAIYGQDEHLNLETRKAVFEQARPFLKTLPALIATQNVPALTCVNAMTILANASRLYAGEGDTVRLNGVVGLSENIWEQIRQKNNLDKDKMRQCLYLFNQVHYTAALTNSAFTTAKKLLDTSYIILRSDTTINQVWARSVERALLRKYIDFFIARGRTDSCRYYLNLLAEKKNSNDPGDGTSYLLYAARVDALGNNFELAYRKLLKAYGINDSVISLKTADINNNLYARLTAEQNQEEVAQLKAQRQRRGLLITVISLAVAMGMIMLILRFRKKEKKAKQKIEMLNRLTQIEIAELEIKANLVQRKLGMELHDDIAGRLVYLCNYIDRQLLEEKDQRQQERLHKINELVRDTYHNTRNKSHEWYTEGLREEQQVFSESVYKLTAFALPDGQYEKQIEIDDVSLQHTPHSIRIQLLRVIQEATVNILKHAGARKVALSVYEDDDTITLQIRDDGKGFDNSYPLKNKGIGLRSVRDIVQHLNGTLDIYSSAGGTELVVAIPV